MRLFDFEEPVRKLLLLLIAASVLACIAAPPAAAQVEVSGAFLFLRTGPTPGPGENLAGWDLSTSVHLIEDLALEADYSDQYPQSVRPGFTELYGPRLEWLSFPHIEPYVHALFGAVRYSGGYSNPTSFGMAFGGGLEVKFTRHVWIRLFQLDYIRSSLAGRSDYEGRISTGLVFRFGRW